MNLDRVSDIWTSMVDSSPFKWASTRELRGFGQVCGGFMWQSGSGYVFREIGIDYGIGTDHVSLPV